MSRYPISKEFWPYMCFAPPLSRRFALLAQRFMKPPAFIWHDPELDVRLHTLAGYRGEEIRAYVFAPKADVRKRIDFLKRCFDAV